MIMKGVGELSRKKDPYHRRIFVLKDKEEIALDFYPKNIFE